MAREPQRRIHATLSQHQRLERITARAGRLGLIGKPRKSADGAELWILIRGLDFAMDKAEDAMAELDGGEQGNVEEVSF